MRLGAAHGEHEFVHQQGVHLVNRNGIHLRSRHGFSLAEMVITLLILAMLLGICASVTRLVTRARSTDGASDPLKRTIDARVVMEQIAADIRIATKIISRSDKSITIQVPDRDADGDPETITYYWAQGLGNDVYMNYNSLTPIEILRDVTNFDLSFTETAAAAPQTVESAEQILISYTGARDGINEINSVNWEAQFINPTLPANAVAWKITRVELLMRKRAAASSGNFFLDVRTADAAFKPTTTVLGTASIAMSPRSTTDTWTNFPMPSPIAGLAPGTGVSLVARSDVAVLYNADIGFDYTVSPALTNSRETYSSNAGATWSTPVATESMIFRVYGTITTVQ
jgi:prepilin-type N-terminal cleavage/methylation domain-containing protein